MSSSENPEVNNQLFRRAISIIWVSLITLVLCVMLSLIAVKFYFLPNINDHKDWIVDGVTRSIQQNVEIEKIDANWEGVYPTLNVHGLRIFDEDENLVFDLPKVVSQISVLALLVGKVEVTQLELLSPTLSVSRTLDGQITAGGRVVYPAGASRYSKVIDWLLKQRSVKLNGGKLSWSDALSGGYSLELKDVVITTKFQDGKSSIEVTSQTNSEWYEAINLSVSGLNVLQTERIEHLSGSLNWDVVKMRPGPFKTFLPDSMSFDNSSVTSFGVMDFDGFSIKNANFEARLEDIALNPFDGDEVLEISQVSFHGSWEADTDRGEAIISDLFLRRPDREVMHIDMLRVERELLTGRYSLVTEALPIGFVKELGGIVINDPGLMDAAAKIRPTGVFKVLQISGKWDENKALFEDLSVISKFDNAGLYQTNIMPGFLGLSGTFEYRANEYAANVFSQDLLVEVPDIHGQSVHFDDFTSNIKGEFGSERWDVNLSNTFFANKDVSGKASLELLVESNHSRQLQFNVSLDKIDVKQFGAYLPTRMQKTHRWLSTRVRNGHLKNFNLKVNSQSGGSGANTDIAVNLASDVESGQIDIGEGWPTVDDIKGRLHFFDQQIRFEPEEATILGADVSNSNLRISGLGSAEATLSIQGSVESSLGTFQSFVRASPVDRHTKGVLSRMNGDGRGHLELEVLVPLNDRSKAVTRGSMRIAGKSIALDHRAPRLSDYDTLIHFEKNKVKIDRGRAQFLGGQVMFSSNDSKRGIGSITFVSNIQVDNLVKFLEIPLGEEKLSGQFKAKGSLRFDSEGMHLSARSDLLGLSSNFPAPLNKSEDLSRSIRVDYFGSKTGTQDLSVELDGNAAGRFIFKDKKLSGARLLSLNMPVENTIDIDGELVQLQLAGWKSAIDSDRHVYKNILDTMSVNINLNVEYLDLGGMRFDELQAIGSLQNGQGVIAIGSSKVDGSVLVTDLGRDTAKFSINMSRLAFARIPYKREVSAGTDLAYVPVAIDAVIDDFEMDGVRRGAVTLRAVPKSGRWQIDELSTITDEGTLTLRGDWFAGRAPYVEYDLDFQLNNVGSYLLRLENNEAMVGGVGRMSGSVSWQGNPFAIDMSSLVGKLSLIVKDGRFAQIKPGAGHLISLLSLQALPRRITLDFRDVFTSGFSYDEVKADVLIVDGIAKTKNFAMEGTSASVAISGEIDLVKKEQKLDVNVTPKLTSVAAVAGAVAANPVVGVATFVAQKILGDPFNKFATRRYKVSGTWAHPHVVQMNRSEVDSEIQ